MKIAVFCMPEQGHFQRLRPVIRGLIERDAEVRVFTHKRFEPWTESVGAECVDLFERFPLDKADDESLPFPCRYVSFAGTYFEAIIELVKEFDPDLIVHDTFAVVAPLVAESLGLPFVNVYAGHNRRPGGTPEEHNSVPVKQVSSACRASVDRLRAMGHSRVNPFSFLDYKSPYLNLYCEPPAFLPRQADFEPVAFFGSLSVEHTEEPSESLFDGEGRKVYISFGTVVWRYFRSQAEDALRALARAFAKLPGFQCVVGLGRSGFVLEERSGFRSYHYVNQSHVLREADVLITHHGLNSTHEAIYHRVPMVSYPFFADQPSLANRCQELGLAVPLTDRLLGKVQPDVVGEVLTNLFRDYESFLRRISEARQWELDVIAGRPKVIDRILNLG